MTREEAIRVLEKEKSFLFHGSSSDKVYEPAFDMAIEALKEEPRPTGHWVDDGEMLWCSNCGNGWDAYFECHEVQLNENGMVGWAMSYPAYCKCCGAKMDGEPKKGKWQWTDDGETGTYTCSECAYHAFGKAWEILNGVLQICPNCGAKMEVEK